MRVRAALAGIGDRFGVPIDVVSNAWANRTLDAGRLESGDGSPPPICFHGASIAWASSTCLGSGTDGRVYPE